MSFDCYGTLIDWETGISAVLGPWARAHNLDVDEDRLLAAYGHHESRLEAQTPDALYPDIVARTMIALGHDLGVPVTHADAAHLAASVPDWPAFPDTQQALASLAEHHELIILSNVDRESFQGSNKRLGIAFTDIITAQDVGSYKPSPRNFEVMIARAAQRGIAHGELLHVAQSCTTTTCPPKRPGSTQSGSTADTADPAKAPHLRPHRRSCPTGSSRRCGLSPTPATRGRTMSLNWVPQQDSVASLQGEGVEDAVDFGGGGEFVASGVAGMRHSHGQLADSAE